MMSLDKKERISWIDMMKGYCMLCVMLQHLAFNEQLNFLPPVYMTFYAPFFLTAFFVSAGLTYSVKRSYKDYFLNKIRTLIVPLFTLGIINILLTKLLSFNEHESVLQQVKDLVFQIGTAGHLLWFIAAMFIFCIVFYPIAKEFKNKKQYIIISISFLMLLNILFKRYIYQGSLPWHVQLLGAGCFWMGIGYLLKDTVKEIDVKKWVAPIVSVVYIGLLVIAYKVFGQNYISLGDFVDNPVLYFALNAVGELFIVTWVMTLPQFSFIQFIGRNTLFYFAFHGKAESIVFFILKKLGMFDFLQKYSYVTSIGMVFLEAVILIVPCLIFNKFLPFMVGKRYDVEKIKRLIYHGRREDTVSK